MTGPGIGGIDRVVHAARERENLRVPQAGLAIRGLAELAERQRLGQRVLQADAAVRIRRRRRLLGHRLAHNRHDERRHRTIDPLDIGGRQAMPDPQSQQRVEVRDAARGRPGTA